MSAELPADETAPPIRLAARILVVDRDDRLLLFRFVDPVSQAAFWITPGGGLDEGETHEDAARRELREETGLDIPGPVGPCVWIRCLDIRYGHKAFHQQERYFLLRVDRPDIRTDGMLDYETQDLTEHRWWSADQITAHPERFAPSRLGQLLSELLAGPLPDRPMDVGA